MPVARRFRLLLMALLLIGGLALPSYVRAYALLGWRWPAGTDIRMYLQLNRAPVAFQDGSASWNASAAAAMATWNEQFNLVRFVEG
ncbi:MAG TPA: hypothetical protein VF551_07620, partial [Chthoniobacterales bacterium]